MSPRTQGAKSAWNLLQASRRSYSLGGVSAPSSKNLWDIVQRDRFENHDSKHVHDIWMEFHADPLKHRVAGVMTAAHPMFVLPIFKGPNAFETIMVQCQMPCVLFTSLEEYKRQGPVAMPFMTLTHYTELQSTQGLVLVRGDIVDPNALTAFEASSLLRMVHEFYTERPKHMFVHAFNHAPNTFDYKRMLDSMGHDTSNLPR